MNCLNNQCDKNAIDSICSIVVSVDGDFVCDEICFSEYKKQKNLFFNETIHDSKLTENFLLGK